ncbi:hypothetical protein SEA_BRUHMOMENT_111 [Arthrobacter phage BruhMoment]|nr:hypothetical protein SEA_BRUHMOMENT_111 [Arthrobacter phage BruhMoment]
MIALDIGAIFARVWRDMAIAYTWPRHTVTRWTSHPPRGKSVTWPLPRSWLGGRTPDPHTHLPACLTH